MRFLCCRYLGWALWELLSIMNDNYTGGQLETDAAFMFTWIIDIWLKFKLWKVSFSCNFAFLCILTPQQRKICGLIWSFYSCLALSNTMKFAFHYNSFFYKNSNDGSIYTNRISTFQNMIPHGWHLFHVAFFPRSQVLHGMSLVHICSWWSIILAIWSQVTRGRQKNNWRGDENFQPSKKMPKKNISRQQCSFISKCKQRFEFSFYNFRWWMRFLKK